MDEYTVLYICDMDHLVSEADLWQAFAPYSSMIQSIKLVRDVARLMGTSHAYVNFTRSSDARKVYSEIRPLFLSSSFCRVQPYTSKQRNFQFNNNKQTALFVKHVDLSVTPQMLYQLFIKYGEIVCCRIAIDDFGMSRQFAYVTFANQEDAKNALELNGYKLMSKQLSVTYNVHKSQRFLRVGVLKQDSNLPFNITEQDIRVALEPYGSIMSIHMPQTLENDNPELAVVTFYANSKPDKAIDEITEIGNLKVKLYFISGGHKHFPNTNNRLANHRGQSVRGNNIFIRPLYNNVNDDLLKIEFEKFGRVLEAKIIYNEFGNSKGYGFVRFETVEQAQAAADALNGKEVFGNVLSIAPALAKPVQKQRIQPRQEYMYYGQYPSMYYMPVQYTLEDEIEELGNILLQRLLLHPKINMDKQLASIVTGLLLQQNVQDIRSWLNDEGLLMKRMDQAIEAYQNYVSSTGSTNEVSTTSTTK